MNCPVICPFLLLGGLGYVCKRFRLQLKVEDGRPVRCRVCGAELRIPSGGGGYAVKIVNNRGG